MELFKDRVCDYCGEPDWSGFDCCQDCGDQLAEEREREEVAS